MSIELVKERFAELKKLHEESHNLPWTKENEEQKWDLEDKIVDARWQVEEAVSELRNDPLFELLDELSEFGVSPVGALDRWISSWC